MSKPLRLRNRSAKNVVLACGADGTTSPQTDGGLFYRLARDYLRKPLRLR